MEGKHLKIPIPKTDYDELAKLAEKTGETVDEVATEAVLEGILVITRRTSNMKPKEILDKYYEVKAENPKLTFTDFLDEITWKAE